MIIRKYKCLLVLIVTLGMVAFLLSGCGSVNEEQTQKPPTQDPKETGNEETTKEPTTDVPGTSISLYPSAQLVYRDDAIIIYATNASLDELFSFYKDFSELKSGPASKTEDGFILETELFRIIRRADQEEIQNEISKSGRLMYVMAYRADSKEIDRTFDEDIISQLTTEGNILWFSFWTN